jgi:hypothetical protein
MIGNVEDLAEHVAVWRFEKSLGFEFHVVMDEKE